MFQPSASNPPISSTLVRHILEKINPDTNKSQKRRNECQGYILGSQEEGGQGLRGFRKSPILQGGRLTLSRLLNLPWFLQYNFGDCGPR